METAPESVTVLIFIGKIQIILHQIIKPAYLAGDKGS